jgi:peptidoglycan hydrolase-like protein with peptidoglycan-binding domain
MALRPLTSSVGQGGVNRRDDTALVQLLLNVERQNARAAELLSVDGIVGPLTTAAITEFQQLYMNLADGRVDPDGPTINALAFGWCAWLRAAKLGSYPPPNFPPEGSEWPSQAGAVADSVCSTLIDIKVYLASLLSPGGQPMPPGPNQPAPTPVSPDLVA